MEVPFGVSGVLSDFSIKDRLGMSGPLWERSRLVISPFVGMGESPEGCISYGLSSAGYDIRAGNEFLVFPNTAACVVNPKTLASNHAKLERRNIPDGFTCVIPPNSFCLTSSVEWLEIPEDIIAIVLGKSTYARCGLCCNFTPLEPGWKGHVTVEISNTNPLPAEVFAGEGIAQVLFIRLDRFSETPYGKKGRAKYQGQKGVTLPVA